MVLVPYALGSAFNELTMAATVDSAIDDRVVDVEANGGSPDDLATALVRSAVLAADDREERLPWLLAHPSFTEADLADAIEADPELLDELGHQQGPPQLLRFLAERYDYEEAILTLAKSYYADPKTSPADFQAFIVRHAESEWMLKSLAHMVNVDSKKTEALFSVIRNQPRVLEYCVEVERQRQNERHAQETESTELMEELFASREPMALRGLANNPRTPPTLLHQLAQVAGIKHAREIRIRAQEALHRTAQAG
jgi:hypothetical protein